MPRFDGTGPQGQGNMGGRRSGRCKIGSNLLGQGGRQRQRNGGQGRFGDFQPGDANQDQGFVGPCIERLHSEIQALQARLADLKTPADK